MLAKLWTLHRCWRPSLRWMPGHPEIFETWCAQPPSWRSFWHHQVPCSGKVLSLVAVHLIGRGRNDPQLLNVCHPLSRVDGTPASLVLPRSSMGTPWDGPSWAQQQDLPGHHWLLFQMGWGETPHQTDQHRDYPPDQECVHSPQDPRYCCDWQPHSVLKLGLCWLCFIAITVKGLMMMIMMILPMTGRLVEGRGVLFLPIQVQRTCPLPLRFMSSF